MSGDLQEVMQAHGAIFHAGLFYNGTTGNLTCFNIDEEFIECADATGCSTGNAAISWDYQVCMQMCICM